MKTAASTAVERDSPVVAPRAPNTLPDAPAPKPAPASAPRPRCSSTSATMPIDTKTWMMVSAWSIAVVWSCCRVVVRPRRVSGQPGTAATMAVNSSAFSEAPPMRPPSMSGIAKSSRALPALTLPP